MAVTTVVHSPHIQGSRGLTTLNSLGLSHESLSWLGAAGWVSSRQTSFTWYAITALNTSEHGAWALYTCEHFFGQKSQPNRKKQCCRKVSCSSSAWKCSCGSSLNLCCHLGTFEGIMQDGCRMHLDWMAFPQLPFHRQTCSFHPSTLLLLPFIFLHQSCWSLCGI